MKTKNLRSQPLLSTSKLKVDRPLVRSVVAAAAGDALLAVHGGVVGAQDVLGLIAPAVVVAGLLGMVGIEIAGHAHRLAAQVNAGGRGGQRRLVVVFLERHR